MKRFFTVLFALAFSCGAVFSGGRAGGSQEINIAMPNNPVSQGLATLTNLNFSSWDPGIRVNVSVLPENDLRQRMTMEAATGGTTFDILFIGPFEAQTWARNGWLENLNPLFERLSPEDKAWYDRDDLIKGMVDSVSLDGRQYGIPFYGESSFVMYNRDLFEAKGLSMPQNPTWTEIYELAVRIHDPSNGIVGMTMRGAPGWGMSGAPFVTMVNAFGGRFFDMQWNATVDTPEQRAAWEMYKRILRNAGQADILSFTYNESLALMMSGNAGIYYDATSLAPVLESSESMIRGRVGYASAPHQKLQSNTAWLWNWTMGLNPKISQARKESAFRYMLWATSKDYILLAQRHDSSGAIIPPASRFSTYSLPFYANLPYAEPTLRALADMDFTRPTYDPVPYVGLQYIAIPEFTDAGDLMTRHLADFVIDNITLGEAIRRTQEVFDRVAIDGGYRK